MMTWYLGQRRINVSKIHNNKMLFFKDNSIVIYLGNKWSHPFICTFDMDVSIKTLSKLRFSSVQNIVYWGHAVILVFAFYKKWSLWKRIVINTQPNWTVITLLIQLSRLTVGMHCLLHPETLVFKQISLE